MADVHYRQHEHGPMPEVEGIGAVADVAEGSKGKHAADRPARLLDCRAGGDDQGGADRGESGGISRKRSRRREDEPGGDNGRHARPPHHRAHNRRHAAKGSHCDRQRRSEPKLPGSCEGREVRRSRVRLGVVDGPRKREDGKNDNGSQKTPNPSLIETPTGGPSTPSPDKRDSEENERDESWPDEIKLLLDRK